MRELLRGGIFTVIFFRKYAPSPFYGKNEGGGGKITEMAVLSHYLSSNFWFTIGEGGGISVILTLLAFEI